MVVVHMDIIAQVQRLPEVYHESIFRILTQYDVDFTTNHNGSFFDLEKVDPEVLNHVRQFIASINDFTNQPQLLMPNPLPTGTGTKRSRKGKEPLEPHVVEIQQADPVERPTFKKVKQPPLPKRYQVLSAIIKKLEKHHVRKNKIVDTGDREEVEGDEDDVGFDEDNDVDVDVDEVMPPEDLSEFEIDNGDIDAEENETKGDLDANDSDEDPGQTSDVYLDSSEDEMTGANTSEKSHVYLDTSRLCQFLKKQHLKDKKDILKSLEPTLRRLQYPVPEFLD